MQLTPGGMFPYIEAPDNLLRTPIRLFQEQVEAALIDATGGAEFGLGDPGTSGILVRDSVAHTITRQLAAPAAGIGIAFNDGLGGNPTFSLTNDLAAVEGLSTTGYVKRTATDAWSTVAGSVIATDLLGASSNEQVIFNDGGAFGGDPGLTFNKTTDILSVGKSIGLRGTVPNAEGGLALTRTGVAALWTSIDSQGLAINLTGSDDLVNFGSYNAATLNTTWTGTGVDNHQVLTPLRIYATHSGTGRIDYGQVSINITAQGGGVMEGVAGTFTTISNQNSTMGQVDGHYVQIVYGGTAIGSGGGYNALFRGRFFGSSWTGSLNSFYGLWLTGWIKGGGTIAYSAAIEIDNTTNIGTAAWAIHSTSPAASLLSGSLTVTVDTIGIQHQNPNAAGSGRIDAMNSGTDRMSIAMVGSSGPNTSFATVPSTGLLMTFATGGITIGASNAVGEIRFNTGGFAITPRWKVTSGGHFYPGVDASYDIGSLSLRPRNIYSSGDVIFNGLLKVGTAPTTLTNAAGQILLAAVNTSTIAANWLPKSNGTNFVQSAVWDGGSSVAISGQFGTVATFNYATLEGNFGGANPDGLSFSAGITLVGDWNAIANGTMLSIDDSSGSVSIAAGGSVVINTGGNSLFFNGLSFSGSANVTLGDDAGGAFGSLYLNGGLNYIQVIPNTLTANWITTLPDANTFVPIAAQTITFTGLSAARTLILYDANFSVARYDATNTFTGNQLFLGHLLPFLTDTSDLGSSTQLWRKGWLSELDTILFAQNTQTLVGGWLVLTKNEGAIPAGQDITAVATSVDFGQGMTLNDFVVFRASLAVEYMQVGSLVSGTRYNVTRNLDGSGANAWPAGSVYRVDGNVGNGRIELNANSTPRISLLTQGATYNAQTELLRIGDLDGGWGTAGGSHDFGFGVGQYNVSGKSSLRIDDSGIHFYSFTTERIRLLADGSGYLANANIAWDASGNATIAGWSVNSVYFAKDTGTNATSSGMAPVDFPFFAGATYANRATAPFRVTPAGSFSATLGSIAGWTINATSLSTTNIVIAAGVDIVPSNAHAWFGKSATGYYGADFRDASNRYIALIAGDGANRPYMVMNDGTFNRIVIGELNLAWGSDGATNSMGMKIWSSAGTKIVEFSSVQNIIAGWTIAASRISSTNVFIDQAGQYISMGATPPTTYGNNVGTWLGYSSGAKLSLYADANNFLQWNGSVLAWKGANSSLDASGNLTVNSGTIGGWSITSTEIRNAASTVKLRGAGNLAFGTTPPISAASGTGLFLDSAGMVGLSGGTPQATFNASDGSITAGGGSIKLDSAGLSLDAVAVVNSIIWHAGGTQVCSLADLYGGGVQMFSISSASKAADSTGNAQIVFNLTNNASNGIGMRMTARGASAGNTGLIVAHATGSQTFLGLTLGGTTDPRKLLDVRGTGIFDGSIKIGGTAARSSTEANKGIDLYDGQAPIGTLSQGVTLYSAAGELRVMDAAGNSTLLSPHDKITNEWIFYSKHSITGKVLRIDMERLMRRLDAEFGGGFIQEYMEAFD